MSSYIQGTLQIKEHNTSLRLLELTNAGLRGKTCKEIIISFNDMQEYTDLKYNMVSESAGRVQLKNVRSFKDAQLFSAMAESLLNCHVSCKEQKAVRVFPILNCDRIKPLKAKPQRWTIPHVIRALVNGQFESLKCNGRYTDDYAWDDALNFRRGEINNAICFAKRIYEEPSGWWCGEEKNGLVSICCHTFDLNEFKPKI